MFVFETNFWFNEIARANVLGLRKILSQKEVWSKNLLVHKNCDLQKIVSKKFGKNQTSNS